MQNERRKSRNDLAVFLPLIVFISVSILIFFFYAPVYQEAGLMLDKLGQEGRQHEVLIFQKYEYVDALCLSAICFLNFLLAVMTVYLGIKNRIAQESIIQEYEDVLEGKDNEIMHYATITATGRVMTDIIHQWKQPLNSLMLIISNIEEDIREGVDYSEEVLELSGEAKNTIRLLSDTISEFRRALTFEGKRSAFEVGEVIYYVIGIFENRIQENDVDCSFECEGNLRVSGKRNMLIQTLINLLDNALDAVEGNAEAGTCERGEIRIRGQELVEGVKISVQDNGGGILPEDLEKVFRPYYSSKGEKGSGLGLAICRNIIQKDFGGSLTVENAERGAEFKIFLPRYGGSADE